MIGERDIFDEVKALVEAEIDSGKTIRPAWLTQAIVATHDRIEGADRDWHRVCSFGFVRSTVRQVVRLYKPEAEPTDPQIVMPGFESLQKAYLITREKERVIVPIQQLTDIEIERKIAELEAMAEGCRAHARELRRYRSERAA
jgi:hypothetical protein